MYSDDDLADSRRLNRLGGFTAGVLFGALAGAAVMWLYAPEVGAKTRKQLAKRAARLRSSVSATYDDTVDLARERAEQMRDRLDEAQDYGQELLAEQKNKVEAVVQAGRQLLRRR